MVRRWRARKGVVWPQACGIGRVTALTLGFDGGQAIYTGHLF